MTNIKRKPFSVNKIKLNSFRHSGCKIFIYPHTVFINYFLGFREYDEKVLKRINANESI